MKQYTQALLMKWFGDVELNAATHRAPLNNNFTNTSQISL